MQFVCDLQRREGINTMQYMQIRSGESEVYVDALSTEHAFSGQPLLECALLYCLKVSFRLPSNRQYNAVITQVEMLRELRYSWEQISSA